MFLFLAGKGIARKYGLLVLCLGFLEAGYSFLYASSLAAYFNFLNLIIVCGPCCMTGFGALLVITAHEFKKSGDDKTVIVDLSTAVAACGIISLANGIWWTAALAGYYARFFYWPLLSAVNLSACLLLLASGFFSLLLGINIKKITMQLFKPEGKNIYPVYRFILLKKSGGIIIIGISFVCAVYNIWLFPLAGF